MTISFEYGCMKDNEFTYDIYKNNEKVGSLDYNAVKNGCYVIDYDLQEALRFDDTSVTECIAKLAKGYISYYENIGEDVRINTSLVNW